MNGANRCVQRALSTNFGECLTVKLEYCRVSLHTNSWKPLGIAGVDVTPFPILIHRFYTTDIGIVFQRLMNKPTLIDLRRMPRLPLALYAFYALAGCASGPLYQPEAPPTADRALLYVYRAQAIPFWMRTAVISINGQSIGSLPNGSYLSVELPVGEHEIIQSWNNWPGDYSQLNKPRTMKLVTVPGGIHFVEFALSQRSQYPYIITNWSIREVASAQGADAIKQCKKQNAEK
jgi:hypothetical protein